MRNLTLGILLALTMGSPAFAQTAHPSCDHQTNISASPQLMAARRTMKNACAADRASLCGNAPQTCGGPMRCLRAHAGQLSPTCAGAMRNVQALRAGGQ
jgi:hypothetical protein